MSTSASYLVSSSEQVNEDHNEASEENKNEAKDETGFWAKIPVDKTIDWHSYQEQRRLKTLKETPSPGKTFRANLLEDKHLQRILITTK